VIISRADRSHSLTEFQKDVLKACRRIPPGRTLTYGQLAEKLGHPRAARAVGNALARNPVPLVVPCHRVVAGGGKFGGFSAEAGVPLKKRLLALEAGGRKTRREE
jgi:methylated-DNA-[protein]-cysteine S-methyltransferase